MVKKISHSSLNTYKQCSQKYFYKYVERLESPGIVVAFFFGKAIDETLNYVLECKKDGKTIDQKTLWDTYLSLIQKYDDIDVVKNMDVNYSLSDVDYYLMEDQDIRYFSAIDPDFHKIPSAKADDQKEYTKWFRENFPEDFQYMAWVSLFNKGRAMIHCFLDDILPLIKEVTSVQDMEYIDNGEGDVLTIIADFRCILDGKVVNENALIQCPE